MAPETKRDVARRLIRESQEHNQLSEERSVMSRKMERAVRLQGIQWEKTMNTGRKLAGMLGVDDGGLRYFRIDGMTIKVTHTDAWVLPVEDLE
jgi:hypothetical protein